MDSTRQIIRWSLPGLVFVLDALVVHGLWIGIIGHRSPWDFINQATAPALVAVVAGGLPGGFLLYQLYFHSYRPVGGIPHIGRVRFPLFYRRDRGGSVLRAYREHGGRDALVNWVDYVGSGRESLDERTADPNLKREWLIFMRPSQHLDSSIPSSLPHDVVQKQWKCQECIRIYEKRFYENWTLLQSMIDYCSGPDVRRWIKTEYTSGSDLYHCLGASRTAACLAAAVAILYNAALRPLMGLGAIPSLFTVPWQYFWLFLILAFFIFGQLVVLWTCRDQLVRSYEDRIAVALAFVSKDLNPQEAS